MTQILEPMSDIKEFQGLIESPIEPLPENFHPIKVSDYLTIYEIVSASAKQKWKLEIFDLSEPIKAHYHKRQEQVIIVLEGQLEVLVGEDSPLQLNPLQTLTIPPGVIHALKPVGKSVRFLALDSPVFTYPEDVFFG